MNNLTQKEIFLLNDQKGHEELCIKKYAKYASEAQDQVLKTMFTKHGSQEEQHLNTLNQILGGKVPNTNQSQQQRNQQTQFTSQPGNYIQQDVDLCYDLLATEKYVSSSYNIAIFEFNDHNIRQALNHIQKEEQEHGEDLFNYLSGVGAYKVQ
ncbi:MAG: spore coat protein [Haloplasmataceae bacterium]|jgi:spore coat protein CotF|nr:spore coat protein [Haloplasmataceae bacterium]